MSPRITVAASAAVTNAFAIRPKIPDDTSLVSILAHSSGVKLTLGMGSGKPSRYARNNWSSRNSALVALLSSCFIVLSDILYRLLVLITLGGCGGTLGYALHVF